MKYFIWTIILFFVGCAVKKSDEQPPIYEVVQDGIYFKAYTKTNPKSFDRAKYIVALMLKNAPDIKTRMVEKKFTIDIIGSQQVLTDLPRYKDLKGQTTNDGRNYDTGTRGLGEPDSCSVGEENLLCSERQMYWEENILVHEFAHSVMSNMSLELFAEVEKAYKTAREKALYPPDIYIMTNSQEYWAESTQAWFNATVRRDVNGGINTRAGIQAHDPEISKILQQVYGDTQINRSESCRY